jgi:signal transduction histidine kinase
LLLLGVLGHDIRTPLGAIRMSGQLLERIKGLDERQSKSVQRIKEDGTTFTARLHR